MDDQGCPRCKTTKYRNPSLKLMVNVCGHTLCENCVELLFTRGSGACPQCNVPLRRSNFRVQLFDEDASVEKEVDIRKKILKDFNKKEEDFATLNEYNDYLEMIETIIYNLANGIDMEQTNKQIEKYRKDNQDQIKKSRTKLSREEQELEELIELEKEEADRLRKEVLQEQLQEQKDKVRNRQALIDKLMFSEGSADQIVASHKRDLQQQAEAAAAQAALSSVPRQRLTQFSSGISLGKRQTFIEVPKAEVGIQYTYTPLTITYCGPEPPGYNELEEYGYLRHLRKASEQDTGGGFHSRMACYRALQDAFSGLYLTCDMQKNFPDMAVS